MFFSAAFNLFPRLKGNWRKLCQAFHGVISHSFSFLTKSVRTGAIWSCDFLLTLGEIKQHLLITSSSLKRRYCAHFCFVLRCGKSLPQPYSTHIIFQGSENFVDSMNSDLFSVVDEQRSLDAKWAKRVLMEADFRFTKACNNPRLAHKRNCMIVVIFYKLRIPSNS